MKKLLLAIVLMGLNPLLSQNNQGYLYGGYESNSQWLLDDTELRLTDTDPGFLAPEDAFRANNYLQLNYNIGDFTAGVQYESYLPSALLGYSPTFDNQNGIAFYYLNVKLQALDITAGYFYEQFGSGLILRSWEDRQLGINSAIQGARVKFAVNDYLSLTALGGQQRNGFELTEGIINGYDLTYDLGQQLNFTQGDLRFGASYVSRYQQRGTNDQIPSNGGAVSGRFDWRYKGLYGNVEAIRKEPDVIANEGQLVSNRLYDGTALQANIGFSKKGLGASATFRRLENFNFYADRLAEGNQFNQQLISYTPALTKQQDYLLTNIYVYNAQPRLITDPLDQRAGEVGFQSDLYLSFPKESALGKLRTKVAANFSYWGGLEATFYEDQSYDVEFIGSGDRYFRDFNAEIKNRWNKNFNTVLTYQNVIADKGVVLGGPLGSQGDIKASIIVAEGTFKLGQGRSVRLVGQHLSTEQDRKNWAGAVMEYNFNAKWSVYGADAYNYGGLTQVHYYNFGGSYTKGRVRFAMNYGRQRGGLICVGGVCRFVPENNGLSMNLNVTF
jgi:hypothetical protein